MLLKMLDSQLNGEMMLLNENYPQIKKEILAIEDEKERDLKIAEWGSSFLPDYAFKASPPRIKVIEDYYKASEEERKKMNDNPNSYREFWANPEIMKYFDESQKIKNLNSANLEFLLWMRNILQNEVIVCDIDEIINTHNSKRATQVRAKIEQPSWTE